MADFKIGQGYGGRVMGFILGLFIGGFIGVTVMCCLFAAKEADDDMNTMSPSDLEGDGK